MYFANDVNQRVIGVIESLGLVVTINKKTGLPSIWHIEKAQPEDYAHLYLKDEDGRITVAPEALTVVDEPAPRLGEMGSLVLSTPIDPKVAGTPSTFRQGTPLQQRLQNLSITTGPQLSPFRASLFKLKRGLNNTVKQMPSIVQEDNDSDETGENNLVSRFDVDPLVSDFASS